MRMERVFSVAACFALIFCNFISARFTTFIEDSPVVVERGEAAILHCRTSIPSDVTEVRWIRIQGENYSIINIFRDGKDQQRCDLPEYIGRTELMTEGLSRGRVALKVFPTSVSDEGTYRCFLQTDTYYDFVNGELRVTALGSVPRIDIEEFQDGGIKAVFRSAGWYPEPTLVNKDEKAEIKIQQEENGLYNVEYSRLITENSNRTFSCRLRTSFHSEDRETSLYVADGLFPKTADTKMQITIEALFGIAFVLHQMAVLRIFILWTRQRRNQDGLFRKSSGNAIHFLIFIILPAIFVLVALVMNCTLWTLQRRTHDGLFRKNTDIFIILSVISFVLFLVAVMILYTSRACRAKEQGVSKSDLPFCSRLAESQERVIHEQSSASVSHSDASSGTNTEKRHLESPLKKVSRDPALTGSESSSL